jgi:hypothetical protein
MIKELDVVLLKEQAVFGTPETSLTGAANFFPALPDSKIEAAPEFQEVEIQSAGYDQDISVRGHVKATVGLSCYMRSIGTAVGNVPDFGLLAKAAGFAASTATGGSKYRHIFVPSTTLIGSDLTAWYYFGGVGASASVLRKVGNIVGDWNFFARRGQG